MAVRIYALAKELKLDSKVLVELCPKAGVTGKGSALASLTDEEVETLRNFITGSAAKSAAKPASKPAAVPVKPVPTEVKPIPMLARPAPSPIKTAAPVEAPPMPAPIVEAVPELEPVPIAAQVNSTVAAEPPMAPPGYRREDYLGPGGSPRRLPVLSPKSDKSGGEGKRKPPGSDGAKPPGRSSPAIKLAPLPPAQQPSASQKPAEPTPQKPDIKLPLDAIRSGKAGTSPLQEHMRKHDEKRKADAAAKKKGGPPGKGAATPAAPADAGLGTGRGRRPVSRGVVAEGEEGPKGAKGASLGSREQRQLNRKKTTTGVRVRRAGEEEETTHHRSSHRRRIVRVGTNTAAPRKSQVVVELPCTVRSFSESIGVSAAKVLGKLLALGKMSNNNAELDAELAELLAVELGVEVSFKRAITREDQLLANIEHEEEDTANLRPRPPVVTFLGHVDHGKTSLLDHIIGIDVVSGESGGITQHIRAYRIEKDGRPIAFVDTPGHEAFTEMRARGANVTDIAVLVVAADDGVMPQTEEAISHAKAAKVPIVVALNKIDLPGINVQRIMEQLAANELLPTDWGGDTEVVHTSAHTGQGMDKLLETLLTIAELHDYQANPDRPAVGTCLEAEQQGNRGVVAKFLVQRGTLKVGDCVVCGSGYGRVKAMYDTLNGRVTYPEAGPSMPVNITGLDVAPGAGDRFFVMEDIAAARALAAKRAEQLRQASLGGGESHVTLENLRDRLDQDEVKTLNLILRADVRGSIEAIQKEMTKLQHPEVQIKVLQATVGGITEADVHLADASDAIIIGFNVVPDEGARVLSEHRGVQIRRYEIIYKVTEDLKLALEGMLKPEKREVELGRALVKRTFAISRLGTIAGCQVLSGTMERNARIRIIRESRIIGDYPLDSLKREKDDAREVRQGFECGMKLKGFNDLKEGDVLEAYKTEEVARTI